MKNKTPLLHFLSLLLAFAVSALQQPWRFYLDINEFSSYGTDVISNQYFNQSACFISSTYSSIPHVNINTVADLMNITSIRKTFPKRILVRFELTALDVTNSSGFFPAYLLQKPLKFDSRMSCSYIGGQGVLATSVLVSYPNITSAGLYALKATGTSDLAIVDLTLDRANSSWWNPGYECSIAAYNPTLIPTTPTSNASTVSHSATCVAFFKLRCNNYWNWNLPTTTCHAIQVTDIARTHLARIRTWGGVYFLGGGNSSISSSLLNGLGPTVVFYGSAKSNGHQYPYLLSSFLVVSNNTITSPFASAIFTEVMGASIVHNYIYDCGFSGVYIRRSLGNTLVEYNYISNVTIAPDNNAWFGSAPIYMWGQGWGMHAHFIRNNWLKGANTCVYLDGTTSNQVFENNVCEGNKQNYINNGRYNIFKNNLFISMRSDNSWILMGQLTMSQMGENPTITPAGYSTCANNALGQVTLYNSAMPWHGHVYPNGSFKSPMNPWDIVSLRLSPQMNWSEWCAPTTAGPKNMPCADSKTTYYNKGVAYPFTCEMYPSNNRLGSTDYVGFTIIYNTTNPPSNFVAGYGSGPCSNNTKTNGAACPASPPGWDFLTYDARQKVFDLNWFNLTWYRFSNASYLLGSSTFKVGSKPTPQNFIISPHSKLARDNPAILNIPISQMGLLHYTPPTSAPTAMPSDPSYAPTAKPSSPSLWPTNKPSALSTFTPTLMPFQNILFTNFVIQSRVGKACLDTNGGANGAQMSSWSYCWTGSVHQWATSDGHSISYSGQCLDSVTDVVQNGDPVVLNPCVAGNPHQFFQFQGGGNGAIVYQNVGGGTMCVRIPSSGNGVAVVFGQCDQSSNTKFFLPQMSNSPVESPTAKPTTGGPSLTSNPTTSFPLSVAPTIQPTIGSTTLPTKLSSSFPTTLLPSIIPSVSPSIEPTCSPSIVLLSQLPSILPSIIEPSITPTITPTTIQPRIEPSVSPSSAFQPTAESTIMPTTEFPTAFPSTIIIPSTSPVTVQPSIEPVILPSTTLPTQLPSTCPSSLLPSNDPSNAPTTVKPSSDRTTPPTTATATPPSAIPSCRAPSKSPSPSPSAIPSKQLPSAIPGTTAPSSATIQPSIGRTSTPSRASPTTLPSAIPSRVAPSTAPTNLPSTTQPSIRRSFAPTTMMPANLPTTAPTRMPSIERTTLPTSSSPTQLPSATPSTRVPSTVPTNLPSTVLPSIRPTFTPSTPSPTILPSATPSTRVPSTVPTNLPSTVLPSIRPTFTPSTPSPTILPSATPSTSVPSTVPTNLPSIVLPSIRPTFTPTTPPPTILPSATPSTSVPSTVVQTISPSLAPTTLYPTRLVQSASITFSPTTSRPSLTPTSNPSSRPITSAAPTTRPSSTPNSKSPTTTPSIRYTIMPSTISPSFQQSTVPTVSPAASLVPSVSTTIAPSPSWTNTVFQSVPIKSQLGNICLDSYGGGNGAQLKQHACYTTSNEVASGDSLRIIVGGMCLDSLKDTVANGDIVGLWQCKSGDYHQYFQFQGGNNGFIKYYNPDGTVFCVNIPGGSTANGVGLIFYRCSATAKNDKFYV